MSPAKKWSVSVVFLLGSLTVVSSAMRLFFIYGLHHRSYEYALDGPSCIWSTVEALLGIVSACLPTLRPLFVRLGKSGRRDEEGGAGHERFDGQAELDERLRRRHSLNSTVMTSSQVPMEGNEDELAAVQAQLQAEVFEVKTQTQMQTQMQMRTKSDASEPVSLGESESSWKNEV